MARPTRDVRRRTFSVAGFSAGDWIILAATVLLFIALIVNWWTGQGSLNSVRYSQVYFVIMLVLILFTIVLVGYPMLESEARLRPLPFASPPIVILIGFVMFLATIFELGRYEGVAQTTVSPGFGIYLALICSCVYLVGALIKWGSRERRVVQ
ncbi:MAG TPA: hypothetical protein VG815_06835 [Chloroflexota bacterium]|nr:hypothetical protein [Chloroflexota bacterium]